MIMMMMMEMMKKMMLMADEGWARVNDLNLVMGCAQCLTLILLLAELCGVGLVSFSLSCAGHPLFIMTPQQQVKPTRPDDKGWTRGQCRGRNTWKKHSNHTALAGAPYLIRQKVSSPVPYKCCMFVFIIAGSKSIMQ